MCKILLQAGSHFMDFQGLRLAMLILQHGPYDIFSEKGVGLCWDSVRRTVWLNLSYPSGSKFWVGAIFWISVGQGYAWPWLCILFRPFQKMDCKTKLCWRLCGEIIFLFNHWSVDEITAMRRSLPWGKLTSVLAFCLKPVYFSFSLTPCQRYEQCMHLKCVMDWPALDTRC